MNLYGHKTLSNSFFATEESFNSMVADGAIIESDWVICPAMPAFNPETQNQPYWAKGQWVITDLSDQEIINKEQNEQFKVELEQNKETIISTLLDLKNGVGTNAERLQRCESALFYLLNKVLSL